MGRTDITFTGAPHDGHRHHRLRMTAAIVAALAGASALMLVAFVVVSASGPARAPLAWVAIAVLSALWATGIWWRWDAPDPRTAERERERRGF